MNTKKVWFVTGASKGLGLSLVKRLIKDGYRVAATSRTADTLAKEVTTSPNFLPLEMDVVNEKSVDFIWNTPLAKNIRKYEFSVGMAKNKIGILRQELGKNEALSKLTDY